MGATKDTVRLAVTLGDPLGVGYEVVESALVGFDSAEVSLFGERDLQGSEFYVPNEYSAEVARAHPAAFLPAISIHLSRLPRSSLARLFLSITCALAISILVPGLRNFADPAVLG